MKQTLVAALLLLMALPVYAQKAESEDVSILRANDRSYADAMNTAARIEDRGLHIKSVHKSKLEGFFRGVWKAALYRTDKGAFEVIFFDEPNQAERITVKEVRDGKRYLYSFGGTPNPDPLRDVMNAAYRNFFIMKNDLLIVVAEDEKLYGALKEIFQ